MSQSADYDYHDFEPNQQSKGDETLLVKFYFKSVQNAEETAAEGRPMFKDKEYIDIRIPGQSDQVTRPAGQRDKLRFPRHYAAFQQRMEMPVDGTPLIEWPMVNRSLADQLAFQGIKTVEQMAELNDSLMGSVHGMQTLKQKARDWLEATKDDGVLSRLRDELVSRDSLIAEQQSQMSAMMARIEALEETPKPKKGK